MVVVRVVPLTLVHADIHEVLSFDQFQPVDFQPQGPAALELVLCSGPQPQFVTMTLRCSRATCTWNQADSTGRWNT